MTVHPNISAAERQAGAQSRLSLRVNLRCGGANRRSQFHERRHLFDCSRNETFFVVAMRAIIAPVGQYRHTGVWTGGEMIVWGGDAFVSTHLNPGGRYDPRTDSWTATGTTDAPDAQAFHTSVRSGSEMVRET